MYKIFMLIAIPVLAITWLVYFLWERKIRIEEEKKPKKVSQRLQKTRSEISDWAQKMAKFEKPPYKPEQNENNKS